MSMSEDEIVALARRWLGTPYRHQASCIGAGCDCLGLVRGVWQAIDRGSVPPAPPYPRFDRDARSGARLLRAARSYLHPTDGTLRPGRVVLFQLFAKLPPRHCAIMVSPQRFIHAQERLGVVEMPLTPSWRRRIHSVYQFPQKV